MGINTSKTISQFYLKESGNHKGRGNFRLIGPTLSVKNLSGLLSVCSKTTKISSGLGGTGAAPPTSKLETILSRPLALRKPIYSNLESVSGKNRVEWVVFLDNFFLK